MGVCSVKAGRNCGKTIQDDDLDLVSHSSPECLLIQHNSWNVKGKHILLLLAQNSSSNLANGPTIQILVHFKWPGVHSVACLIRCQNQELLAPCRVHSEWPHGVRYLPFSQCGGVYISCLIRQWRNTSFYCKGSWFFLPVALPNRYCQWWAMWYSSFGFWTNPCSRLVGYLLVRVPEISAQPQIKIPFNWHFNRNISCILNWFLCIHIWMKVLQ